MTSRFFFLSLLTSWPINIFLKSNQMFCVLNKSHQLRSVPKGGIPAMPSLSRGHEEGDLEFIYFCIDASIKNEKIISLAFQFCNWKQKLAHYSLWECDRACFLSPSASRQDETRLMASAIPLFLSCRWR